MARIVEVHARVAALWALPVEPMLDAIPMSANLASANLPDALTMLPMATKQTLTVEALAAPATMDPRA